MCKNTLHKFELVVYPATVWIAIDCSESFLQERFKEDFIRWDDKLAACVYTLGGDILIRFRSKSCMTVQYMSHESTHAALYIFDYMGCKVDYDNQEPFAFLVDCITNFCNETKNKK